jgi:hypothetical protein
MPPNNEDRRVREGLKFLTQADKAVIRAAGPLHRLVAEPQPQGIAELLEEFSFDVGDNSYVGRMTEAQAAYLRGYRGSLEQFADAIAGLLVKMNARVVDALTGLSGALDVPAGPRASMARNAGIGEAATGCCTYDNTQQDGITETFCVVGLQGTWDPNPCPSKPSTTRKKLARAGR